jgi:adenine-specific DNA-methyltransferase
VTKQTTKSNPESMGRFHTNWLNMMWPRLRLAANLLRDDGVIFISIDDHEVHNLRKLCDEIFGEEHFIADFIWRKKSTSTNVANAVVSALTDHIICYAKTDMLCINRRKTSVEDRKYPFSDEEGNYRTTIIEKKDSGDYARATMKFKILGVPPREGKRWQIGEATAREYEKKNRFILDEGTIKLKIYDFEDSDTFSANPNLLLEYGSTDSASKSVNQEIFGVAELFSNPKPLELIKHLLSLGTQTDSIVLDFFSGSATTAHAVMQLNAEGGGNRRFILVQLPELTPENSEANKAGYINICEIGKERIRRAGNKIKDENGLTATGLDTGFRVFKLDSSNINLWNSDPIPNDEYGEEILLNRLLNHLDILKKDRTPEDVTFEVMLKLGQDLCTPITPLDIGGKTVYGVGEDITFIVCLAENVTLDEVKEMADYTPGRIVFADRCFTTTEEKANVRLTLRDKGITIKTL